MSGEARVAFDPIVERAKNGGVQKIYRFDNGYGASVVRGPYTYGGENGLWELAVLEVTDGPESEWDLTYETSITNEVLGYLLARFDEGMARARLHVEAFVAVEKVWREENPGAFTEDE